MPKAILSLEGYIRKIVSLNIKNKGAQLLFRGHSDIKYSSAPSIFRNSNHTASEHLMIRQLLSQHPKEFSDDKGIFDQLVRAQHYGLPTRLLDVSLNPLVALYFAACSRPKSRAQVIVFKPNIGKQKYFDSDSVTCICSLALLTDGEVEKVRNEIKTTFKKCLKPPYRLNEAELQKFNDLSEVSKLVQIVRQEKPDFRPIIQPIDIIRPVSVTPRKHHARILAQNGAFIAFGLAMKPNASNMRHIETDVIDVGEDAKDRIMKELSQIGVTKSSLFPEIENAAIAIGERYR